MEDYFFKCLSNELSLLCKGEVCWAVIAGSGTGSMATFYFGNKVPRKRLITNPNISDIAKIYEGQYCLYLEDCDWIAKEDKEIIADCNSSNKNKQKMVTSLNKFIGKHVMAFNLHPKVLNLDLIFSDRLSLHIFCEKYSSMEKSYYTYFTPSKIYSIGSNEKSDISIK